MDVKGGGRGEGQNGGDVADDATGAIFHRVVGSCFVRLHRRMMKRSTPLSVIMTSPWSENFDHEMSGTHVGVSQQDIPNPGFLERSHKIYGTG